MKIFFISIMIFGVMSGVIVFNSIYINKTTDRLDELAEAVTAEGYGINELENFWDKNMKKVDFSVNHTLVNDIGIRIKNIRYFSEVGETKALGREIMLLREDLKELKRLDKISFNNIF